MAKPAKTDRQAVIDSIRSKQRGAERRRGYMIVGVCVAIAVLIMGSAWWVSGLPLSPQWFDQREFRALDLDEVGAPADVCDEPITKKASGTQDHVPPGTPIPYEDSPPVFGQHYDVPDTINRKLYVADDRPDLGTLVHNLEHGYTVLWYDETIADDEEQMQMLGAIADKFDGDDDNQRNKFKAVPWTSEDGEPFPDDQHIALTHWTAGEDGSEQQGVWQYCSETSGAAVQQFMQDYPYLDSPEPGGM